MERTKCACAKCQVGCQTMPGYLVPADLVNFDTANLRSSQGATVAIGGRLVDVPTLVPAQNDDGTCVFYQDGQCAVHDHAPFGCRMFSACDPDPHMDRSVIAVKQVMDDHQRGGRYSKLTLTLPPARPRSQRRRDYAVRLDQLDNM